MAKKWIAGAIKHPGSLRAKAKRAHLIKGEEKLSAEDLDKLAKRGGQTAKQANLARTLKRLPHGSGVFDQQSLRKGYRKLIDEKEKWEVNPGIPVKQKQYLA